MLSLPQFNTLTIYPLMTYPWSRTVIPIALLYVCRMLGLFLVLPVFTAFASELSNATPALTGIALGAYGLAQACIQIPFGMCSDHLGRKLMISLGLLLLILGSLMGALTHSIYGMIFARILQGTGAIGSVLMALLSDLTPSYQRNRAMAVIGGSIGVSFSLAIVLGPFLAHHFGFSSLFYFTAILGTLGLFVLLGIPTPVQEKAATSSFKTFKLTLFDSTLQRLNVGIFFQHAILTSTFFALPLLLKRTTAWHIYLPIIVLSFLLMVPLMMMAERKQKTYRLFQAAIISTTLAQAGLAFFFSHAALFFGLLFYYFVAFNLLEAMQPSFVSTHVPAQRRGTAMGIYSTSQFLGIFAGGTLAGLIYPYGHATAIFAMNAVLGGVWLKTTPFPSNNHIKKEGIN